MGGAQPTLAHGCMRIERTLERHFLSVRVKHSQHEEQICICGRRRNEKFRARWACDFGFLCQWLCYKSNAIAHCVERYRTRLFVSLVRERKISRIKPELCPSCTTQWPLIFLSQHEFLAWVTHVELNGRLFVPTGIFIF